MGQTAIWYLENEHVYVHARSLALVMSAIFDEPPTEGHDSNFKAQLETSKSLWKENVDLACETILGGDLSKYIPGDKLFIKHFMTSADAVIRRIASFNGIIAQDYLVSVLGTDNAKMYFPDSDCSSEVCIYVIHAVKSLLAEVLLQL